MDPDPGVPKTYGTFDSIYGKGVEMEGLKKLKLRKSRFYMMRGHEL
jgi:hypothetical protein